MITWVITHHFTLPIIHLFNPLKKLCTTIVSNFSWVFTVVRREIEDNAYAKLGWGGGGGIMRRIMGNVKRLNTAVFSQVFGIGFQNIKNKNVARQPIVIKYFLFQLLKELYPSVF